MLAATLACCAPAAATSDERAHYITFENDLFFHTDRYYSNGIQLSTKRSKDARSRPAQGWTGTLCRWFGCDDAILRHSHAHLGQLMYTPRDVTRRAAQPLDRPWAAMLFYEHSYTFLSRDEQVLTTLASVFGVTGRHAFGEQTQKFIHRLFDRPEPRGWDTQLGSSLALMATVDQRNAVPALSADLAGGVQLRTARHWRLGLGNIMSFAGGGLTVVLGRNLPDVPGVAPGIANKRTRLPLDSACLASWVQCTAFASAEARLMAYNVFLDGRLLHDDPFVERRRAVADVSVGLRLDFPRTRGRANGPWFVQFKATRRTPEFRAPRPIRAQSFGALSIGTDF